MTKPATLALALLCIGVLPPAAGLRSDEDEAGRIQAAVGMVLPAAPLDAALGPPQRIAAP